MGNEDISLSIKEPVTTQLGRSVHANKVISMDHSADPVSIIFCSHSEDNG